MDGNEKLIFGSILISYTLLVLGIWEYFVRPVISFAQEVIHTF